MTGTIRVRVRLFAFHRERVGRPMIELELPAGARVADVWRSLVSDHPALKAGEVSIRFAVNRSYAGVEEQLSDADEVAVIPPVAGGDGRRGAGTDDAARGGSAGRAGLARIGLTEAPIDDERIGAWMREIATTADGAVVVFVGRTRETAGTPAPGQEEEAARHAGERVVALDYEAYEAMALAVLREIADEIESRFGVERLRIVHRTGRVPLGEASVLVVAAAPHRDEAFDACRYAIDELKARAPIWKSERFEDGAVWIGAPSRTGRGTR